LLLRCAVAAHAESERFDVAPELLASRGHALEPSPSPPPRRGPGGRHRRAARLWPQRDAALEEGEVAVNVRGGATGCSVADAELMWRWNVSVDAVAPQTRDFHWRSVSDVPHPTSPMGGRIASGGFVDVLPCFCGEPSNLDFVTRCELLDKPFASGPPLQRQKDVRLRERTASLRTFFFVSADRQAAPASACEALECP
jgi:hypothetical protein